MRIKSLFLFIVTVLILSACGTNNEESHQSHSHGDLQEKTASANVMSTFLDGQMERFH
ncbi:MAG: PCYCGC motif-containing (lipo)protein [Bacillota bacterium]